MKRTDTQPSGPEHRASDEQPVPRVVSYGVVLAAQGRIDYRTFLFANVGDDSEHPARLRYVRDVALASAATHGIELHELRKVKRDGTVETLYGRLDLRRRALLDMTTPPIPANPDGAMDVNAIVSYNLRAIRRQRGMTQDDVADGLARLTGHRLPQASISAMERGVDSTRRRRFDAHELYLLATVFRVPIAYFFLPPAGEPRHLADTGRPVRDLYTAVLGTGHQLDDVIDRLAAPNRVDAADDGFLDPETWLETFLTWREQRIAELASDPLDGAAQRLIGDLIALRRALQFTFCDEHQEDDTP